jgi:hypothetical protein
MTAHFLDLPQKLNTAEHPGCIFQHLNIFFEDRKGGYLSDLILQQWRDGSLHHVRFSSSQGPRILEAMLCSLRDLNRPAYDKCLKTWSTRIAMRRKIEASTKT